MLHDSREHGREAEQIRLVLNTQRANRYEGDAFKNLEEDVHQLDDQILLVVAQTWQERAALGYGLQLVHQERYEIHDLVANLLIIHVNYAEFYSIVQVVYLMHRGASLIFAKIEHLLMRSGLEAVAITRSTPLT